MKLNKFGVISQGLALPLDVFDVKIPEEEGIDLTDKLDVVSFLFILRIILFLEQEIFME